MNRIHSLDILKFLGALCIATLHLHWEYVPQGYLFVEMFFIISGFMIGSNREKYISIPLLSIFLKRLYSFYPLLIFAIGIFIILYDTPKTYDLINALLMLGDIGFGERYGFGNLWFLGVYLLVFIFYIYILKAFSLTQFSLITLFVVIISIYCLYFYSPARSVNILYDYYIGVFPFCLIRGVAAIGLGILLGIALETLEVNANILLITELFCLYLLIKYVFAEVTPKYDFINYFVCMGLITSLSQSNNAINKLLEAVGKKANWLFSLSLEIYILHTSVIAFSERIGIKQFFINYVFVYLIVVVICAFMIHNVFNKLRLRIKNFKLQAIP